MISLEEVQNIESHEYQIHAAATFYAERRIPVVPIVPNGKSLPPKETGINYQSASFNLKTIDKWFHPMKGKFRGFNIGIACGGENGFFALDVDTKGEHDGKANLERIMRTKGVTMIDCPIAITPNDGEHYLFKWIENAKSSSHKIAKGIDTRGSTDAKKRSSHIVVYPSKVDRKQYHWKWWTNDIPTCPAWIIEILGDTASWGARGGRGNEQVGVDDVEQLIPHKQIEKMLTYVNPDDLDYDQWLRIGLAIKSQYPEEDGLLLWDEWSKTGTRYKQGECDIRWEGFSDFGTVRAGTLFWYAKEGGWEPEKGDKRGNLADKLVAEMNEKYAICLIGGKLRVLYEKWNPIETEPNYTLLDRDSFIGFLQNQTVTVTDGDKEKKVPVSAIWLAHEGRRTYENGLALFPGDDAPRGYFNTWGGFSVESARGRCDLFLSHVHDVICAGNNDLSTWLLDWIADMFQDPGNPKGCAIVMRGEEGVGKGAMANTLGMLFGSHYRHLIEESHLTSNFNAHMMDAICVFADEITWGGNKKTAGKLKGLITEMFLIGERKGVDALPYRNMCHVMIASNNDWVIPADTNSRRWFVLDVPSTVSRDREYFNNLHAEIDSKEGRSAILHYFLNRMVTSDLRRALETVALRKQQMYNTWGDTVFNWYRERLLDHDLGVIDHEGEKSKWPEFVRRMDLYEAYRTRVLDGREQPVRENVFGKRVKELGLRSSRVRTSDSQRPYCYKVPPLIEAANKLNAAVPGAISHDEDDDSNTTAAE